MSVCAKQSWFRRLALAGAVFATAALATMATPRPALAQYAYPYTYPYYGYYPSYYPYYPAYYPYY